MSLYSRRALAPEFARDRLLDLLSTSPYVQEKVAEEHSQRVAERQALVDTIAAARATVESKLPALERKARDAHARLTPILQKLRAAEGEYVTCVRELADLDFQTSRRIDRAEAELRRTADPAIQDFIAEAEEVFHLVRNMPRWEVEQGKLNNLTGLRQPPPSPLITADAVQHALDLIRHLQRQAEAMKTAAVPNVAEELNRLRKQLPQAHLA